MSVGSGTTYHYEIGIVTLEHAQTVGVCILERDDRLAEKMAIDRVIADRGSPDRGSYVPVIMAVEAHETG